MKYNPTQWLVSQISGYDPMGEQSPKNDAYYELQVGVDKCCFLSDYVQNIETGHSHRLFANIREAYNFLESDFSGENERYHAFKEL